MEEGYGETDDITLDIFYDVNFPEKTVIRTNARKEALEEILEAWLQDQMGAGSDPSPPAQRDLYRIMIGLNLDGDRFRVVSDTGNKGLTAGIMDIFKNLSTICVAPPTRS